MNTLIAVIARLLGRVGLSHEHVRELVGYGLATVVAFALDIGLLTLLVSRAGMHYVIAASLSFIAGGVLLYVLCVRFVFRARRVANRTLELSYFVALGVAGLVVQTVVMVVAVDLLGAHYLLAKLSAACCTFIANFLLRRTLLFSAVTPGSQARVP
jgi:putative flippase GtrA